METIQPPKVGGVTDTEKALGAIAYLGPLFIVSYLAANNSKFVKFHAAQGLALFLAALAARIVLGILLGLTASGTVGGYSMMMSGGGVIGVVMALVNVGVFALAIMGIVKAVQAELWEMPVLGEWAKKVNL